MKTVLPHNHPANRIKACLDCGEEQPPENFPVHRHPYAAMGLASMPRCFVCHKRWKSKTAIMRKYGLTESDYNNMLDEQQGCCHICGSTGSGDNKNKLAVDHCHDTGKVRGLLCWPCNIGIGMFKERPDLIEKVVKYLER